MKNLLLTFCAILFALSGFSQEEATTPKEPNTLRYYLKDGSTYDVRLSEVEKISRIGTRAVRNVYKETTKKGMKDFYYDDIDSMLFVHLTYTDEIIDNDNVNRNTHGKNTQNDFTLLELPRFTTDEDDLFVQHSTDDYGVTYSIEYDCSKKAQRWTAYQLHAGNLLKNTTRHDSFTQDPDIPSKYQAEANDYKNSGFSRGHMCPSGDRLCSVEQNKQTFYYSNMHPQYQNLNGGHWGRLEDKLRNRANSVDTLYLVKGGTIADGDILQTIGNNDIPVPGHFFMAIMAYKKSTNTYSAIGVWMPHENVNRKEDLSTWVCTIDELEEKTGIDFFCNLPDEIEEQVESTVTLNDWGL